ncbi:hypothetical protein ACVCEA_07545 [Escherichia coli]
MDLLSTPSKQDIIAMNVNITAVDCSPMDMDNNSSTVGALNHSCLWLEGDPGQALAV